MQDTIEVTLPVSKVKAVIRNYTTRADDEKAETVLYDGVEAQQNTETPGSRIKFPVANVMASQRVYIPLLVQSIDGKPDFDLAALRSADYESIEQAVNNIVEQNSPKAKAPKSA